MRELVFEKVKKFEFFSVSKIKEIQAEVLKMYLTDVCFEGAFHQEAVDMVTNGEKYTRNE